MLVFQQIPHFFLETLVQRAWTSLQFSQQTHKQSHWSSGHTGEHLKVPQMRCLCSISPPVRPLNAVSTSWKCNACLRPYSQLVRWGRGHKELHAMHDAPINCSVTDKNNNKRNI